MSKAIFVTLPVVDVAAPERSYRARAKSLRRMLLAVAIPMALAACDGSSTTSGNQTSEQQLSARSTPARTGHADVKGGGPVEENVMQSRETSEVVRRFNQAFQEHNPALLKDLIGPDCVMESIQPAPDGTRYEGYDVNLAFWKAMATDRANHFEVEDTVVMGDRANIRWRFHFGDGGSIRGVSLIRVRDGRIVEALAYAKTPGQSAPLPK